MLLTRKINEFLNASYTLEQVLEWDPLWTMIEGWLEEGLAGFGPLSEPFGGS